MTDSPQSTHERAAWPGRTEWLLIVGAWTTVAFLTSVNRVLAPRGGGPAGWTELPAAFGREMFEYGFFIVLTPIVFWLARRFPLERPGILRNGALHLVTAVAAAFTVDATDMVVRRLLVEPSAHLAGASVLRVITRLWFINELVVYFVILAGGFARDYYLQKKQRQEEAERLQERASALEQQLAEARLEALRMQLNPHFLFNTLHAVSTLVGKDPKGVRRMIARLSDLLRRVLDESAPQEMALAEELDVIEGYFEIQKIRFQGRLDVAIDVPSSLRDAQVPYLILQPLAENAVKHGASQVRGTGCITIRARRDGGDLVIEVQDNGPGLPADGRDAGGIGLQNVRARLAELYGPASSLAVDPVPDGEGVITTLRLPYHTEDDLYAPGETVPARDRRASGEPDPAPNGGAAAPNGSSDTAAGAETDPAPTSSPDHG